MKKYILTTCLLALGVAMQAQDTYFNNQLTNTSGDVYGSARFVGMGGAMGALGADISTISWNPAGIGLMRKSNVAFTAGAAWSKKGIEEKSTTNATLDQFGIVYNVEIDEDVPYLNIGFNYQKKLDFNGGFYADNPNLGGLSQMDILAQTANLGYDTNDNLAGMAVDNLFLSALDKDGNLILNDKTPIDRYVNRYKGLSNNYTQYSSGSLNAFDINISGNYRDRFFFGLTFGVDNLRYRGWNDYFEVSRNAEGVAGDYSVYNDHAIDGNGFNVKVGFIYRPIEDNPLRVALAAETPTWYQFKRSNLYSMTDHIGNYSTNEYESYLEYSVRTPFKFRAGVGSTVGNYLAWDVDYEFANYRYTAMGYPDTYVDDPNSSLFNNTWDKEMNRQTKANMKPAHNVRAGIEFKPTKSLALRAGYNFATSPYEDKISMDQVEIDSYSMNKATTTSLMRLSDIHSLTLGLGYSWKYGYVDLAYKTKMQKGDFYAFDAASASNGSVRSLTPVNTELTRSQITATLGFKF